MRNTVAAPRTRTIIAIVGLTLAAVALLFTSASTSSASQSPTPAPAAVGQQSPQSADQHAHPNEKLRVPWNSWLTAN